MPEGPEIKYLSEFCKNKLKGCELINIKSNTHTEINVPNKSKVIDVISKGKLLVIVLKDYYFHIHFGLTGLLVFDNPEYPRYEIEFKQLDEEKSIVAYIDDSRKLSKLKFLNKNEHDKEFTKLGIDILTEDFTLKYFRECCESVKKKIVAFLLEQDKFCGIGNYIKNESLYIAKINPYRTVNDLSDDEIEALYNSILFCAYSNTKDYLEQNKKIINKKDKKDKSDESDESDELNKFIKLLNSIETQTPYVYKVYQQKKDPDNNIVTNCEIAGRKTFYVKDVQK